MAVGNTSFDDWEALTWSLGCTGRPSRSAASWAITSLAFMFDDVPEPVWNTSIGKWSFQRPVATSAEAATMASAISPSTTPRRAFTTAAAPLTAARAAMRRPSIRMPEIGKFSVARWVWAAHLAHAGTWTSPMESCSVRLA